MNGILSPTVQNERCTRYRFRYSECARCAEACPHDALRLTEEGGAIDATACRDCGLCLGACPTDAFQSRSFSRAALLRAALEAKVFTVACAPSGAAGDMTLPCLGALDAATAAFIAARGTEIRLAGMAHCAECAHGAKGEAAVAALVSGVDHARAALEGERPWGEVVATGESGAAVDRLGAGRRQLFRRLVAGGAARLTEGEAPATPIAARAVRAAAHYKPLNRELVDRLLGERVMAAHPALPAGRVTVQGACNACDLCDRVCPTGALQSIEQEGWWQLEFRAAQCVGCGVCIEACQPGALALGAEVGAGREGERLFAMRRQRCEQCGRLYVPADEEAACPACADDDRSFAAIFG